MPKMSHQRSRDPWVDLATAMIESAVNVLTSPSNAADAAAHIAGFENAEHEALAFLASDLFEQLVDHVQGCQRSYPGQQTPQELVRVAIRRAYGDKVRVVDVHPPGTSVPIVQRKWDRPDGKQFLPHLGRGEEYTGFLVRGYEQTIEAESIRPDQLILVLPGVEVSGLIGVQ